MEKEVETQVITVMEGMVHVKVFLVAAVMKLADKEEVVVKKSMAEEVTDVVELIGGGGGSDSRGENGGVMMTVGQTGGGDVCGGIDRSWKWK